MCTLLLISDTTGVLVIQNRVTESEKGYKIDLILTIIETIHDPDHPSHGIPMLFVEIMRTLLIHKDAVPRVKLVILPVP